jgi:ABC-type Mn2+/Zn2+ transport system permease subunit
MLKLFESIKQWLDDVGKRVSLPVAIITAFLGGFMVCRSLGTTNDSLWQAFLAGAAMALIFLIFALLTFLIFAAPPIIKYLIAKVIEEAYLKLMIFVLALFFGMVLGVVFGPDLLFVLKAICVWLWNQF